MFLDFLNKNYLGGEFKTFKNSKIIEGNIDNEKVILAKPQTYMNLSGDAVIKLKNWYKVDNNDILVIYDDFHILFLDYQVQLLFSYFTFSYFNILIFNKYKKLQKT